MDSRGSMLPRTIGAIMRKKRPNQRLDKAKLAAEAARKKFATASVLAAGLKTQVDAAKARAKEARKKLKLLRRSLKAALKSERSARSAAEKAAVKLRKLEKKNRKATQ